MAPEHALPDAEALLIHRLTADLRPVRRLASPPRRALAWLLVVAALALALAATTDVGRFAQRLAGATDMWLSVVGSVATAVLAAVAAFELSLPDRRPSWMLLPLPALAVWVGASGMGCLRSWVLPATHVAVMGETMDCLRFIVGLSVPLSAVLLLMLRRARPLRPVPVAAMGGLAAAAAAASLLGFVHPFDAGAVDLGVHAAAVILVVLLARGAGVRVLASR